MCANFLNNLKLQSFTKKKFHEMPLSNITSHMNKLKRCVAVADAAAAAFSRAIYTFICFLSVFARIPHT